MPEIRIKHYIFKPGIIPSIVTCLLIILMIYLANWQLDRAEYKANLQSIIETRQTIQPVSLNSLINKEENDWLYHPVQTAGKFDPAHQIYLDNQVNNTIAGYTIYTPLKLSNNIAILVNRGWIPPGKNRDNLPDISLHNNNDPIKISGLLAAPPAKGLVLSNNANNYQHWPTVLQFINTTEIEQALGYKLLPMILIINSRNQTEYEIMPIKINMRSEKHQAYAFQWFGLSLTLLIIYIIVNTKNTHKVSQVL